MDEYILYNADVPVAQFTVGMGTITAFSVTQMRLVPMQLQNAGAEGFALWLNNRAIDVNTIEHRNMVKELLGTRDKLSVALKTHMLGISDTFTCFKKGEFTPRNEICRPGEQEIVSKYILVSSDTSLRNLGIATPNASTDGSFPKTWQYENGSWWLYKKQSETATMVEVEISQILAECGWDSATYEYGNAAHTQVKTLNFLREGEFFEPYESFRYSFSDRSDDDDVILRNIASLGATFARAWKRILLSDAFFMNTDRHMRNFGVIRSAKDGSVMRLAPNFDNNQAYTANPSGKYSDTMLKALMAETGETLQGELRTLAKAALNHPLFSYAVEAAKRYI